MKSFAMKTDDDDALKDNIHKSEKAPAFSECGFHFDTWSTLFSWCHKRITLQVKILLQAIYLLLHLHE